MRRFRPMLAQHDITEQQWRVLRALAASSQPITVGEVADRTYLLGPSLSRMLVGLEQRSLIKRTTSVDDLRRSNLALTTHGQHVVSKIGPFSESIYSEIETAFGLSRLNHLINELNDLAVCLTPTDSEPE